MKDQIFEQLCDELREERADRQRRIDELEAEVLRLRSALPQILQRLANNPFGDHCGNCRRAWPCGCQAPERVCGLCGNNLISSNSLLNCTCSERELDIGV